MLARGARSSRRRFGGALEPFALLDVEFVPGRTGLGRLQQARIDRAFPAILASLPRMRKAGEALELARALLPEGEPAQEAFAATVDVMGLIESAPEEQLPQPLLGYQLRMLSLCGFAPQLSQCGHCGRRPGESQAAMFDPVGRHLSCRACGGGPLRLSARGRATMSALAGSRWDEVAAIAWPTSVTLELEAVVTALVTAQPQRT